MDCLHVNRRYWYMRFRITGLGSAQGTVNRLAAYQSGRLSIQLSALCQLVMLIFVSD